MQVLLLGQQLLPELLTASGGRSGAEVLQDSLQMTHLGTGAPTFPTPAATATGSLTARHIDVALKAVEGCINWPAVNSTWTHFPAAHASGLHSNPTLSGPNPAPDDSKAHVPANHHTRDNPVDMAQEGSPRKPDCTAVPKQEMQEAPEGPCLAAAADEAAANAPQPISSTHQAGTGGPPANCAASGASLRGMVHQTSGPSDGPDAGDWRVQQQPGGSCKGQCQHEDASQMQDAADQEGAETNPNDQQHSIAPASAPDTRHHPTANRSHQAGATCWDGHRREAAPRENASQVHAMPAERGTPCDTAVEFPDLRTAPTQRNNATDMSLDAGLPASNADHALIAQDFKRQRHTAPVPSGAQQNGCEPDRQGPNNGPSQTAPDDVPEQQAIKGYRLSQSIPFEAIVPRLHAGSVDGTGSHLSTGFPAAKQRNCGMNGEGPPASNVGSPSKRQHSGSAAGGGISSPGSDWITNTPVKQQCAVARQVQGPAAGEVMGDVQRHALLSSLITALRPDVPASQSMPHLNPHPNTHPASSQPSQADDATHSASLPENALGLSDTADAALQSSTSSAPVHHQSCLPNVLKAGSSSRQQQPQSATSQAAGDNAQQLPQKLPEQSAATAPASEQSPEALAERRILEEPPAGVQHGDGHQPNEAGVDTLPVPSALGQHHEIHQQHEPGHDGDQAELPVRPRGSAHRQQQQRGGSEVAGLNRRGSLPLHLKVRLGGMDLLPAAQPHAAPLSTPGTSRTHVCVRACVRVHARVHFTPII